AARRLHRPPSRSRDRAAGRRHPALYSMTALFITATGTDIGKTFVTAGLIRALRHAGRTVDAAKPVISGFTMGGLGASDTGVLLSAMGRDLNPQEAERISPWRFTAPLSPDMAAEAEGT